PLNPLFGVRRGKLDLVSTIVPKLERRRSDFESLRPLDETSPIGSTAEFAVGHNFKADLLLQRDDITDALILQSDEFGVTDLPGGMFAECVTQDRRPKKASDVISTKWWAALGRHAGSGNSEVRDLYARRLPART